MRSSLFAPRLLSLAAVCFAAGGLPACSDDALTPVASAPAAFGPLGERADLPVDERLAITGLTGPVDVVRDVYGRPHIYATSLADAVRVEGYLVAKDRTLQVDFFRRIAEGRLAEILAGVDPSLIDLDIAYRHIGLARVAQRQYDAMPEGEAKALLDAYADGITQAFRKIRSKEIRLPDGIFSIDLEAFTDWTAVDSLAVARLQQHLLSYSGDEEITAQLVIDSLRQTFAVADPDPLVAKRAGIERDMLRFAPATNATTTGGYPESHAAQGHADKPLRGARTPVSKGHPHLAETTRGYLEAMSKMREMLAPDGFGSNNWAVSAERSASGRALLASDPHLPLNAPSIFWPVSIDVDNPAAPSERLRVGGVSFPGIPGIILGHNEHIAWGATVAGYDVTDVYEETLTADGSGVIFEGKAVPFETIDEVIEIQGAEPYTYQVRIVPHHGPIQPTIDKDHHVVDPDPALGALSVRWTGHEVTRDLDAVIGLLRAKNVDEAREALSSFDVGAQNWMIADTSGDILWTSHALLPLRDKRAFTWDPATYSGQLPCLLLPGDGSAEWKGYLDDDQVPWEKNAPKGYIATANNDPLGDTLDDDPSNDTLADGTPMFTACSFDPGFREARIQERLETTPGPLTPEDMASIQGDVRSALGARLVPRLIDALDRAAEERKSQGTHLDLTLVAKDPAYDAGSMDAVRTLLANWGDYLDYQAASGVSPDTLEPLDLTTFAAQASQATLVFNTWLVRVLRRTFGDELSRAGWRSLDRGSEAKLFLRLVEADPGVLATYDEATGDSAIWDDMDTPEIESRQDRMVRAMLDALTWLADKDGPDLTTYRWGNHHTVQFSAIVPLFGQLSIPPSTDALFSGGFPRPGDSFSVDASSYSWSTALDASPNFSYAHGPSQRFVAEMSPEGPTAWNAIPGGNIWDRTSPHFADEAELWRRNETHEVPFLLSDVVAKAESRTVVTP